MADGNVGVDRERDPVVVLSLGGVVLSLRDHPEVEIAELVARVVFQALAILGRGCVQVAGLVGCEAPRERLTSPVVPLTCRHRRRHSVR